MAAGHNNILYIAASGNLKVLDANGAKREKTLPSTNCAFGDNDMPTPLATTRSAPYSLHNQQFFYRGFKVSKVDRQFLMFVFFSFLVIHFSLKFIIATKTETGKTSACFQTEKTD